ncbi:alpha 1,2 mannosyltransferase [Coemansia nantahalensis]|uniref:Alpha 1,2 mannosyltransferase n=1 Tax=Coemansia nantahalensis TaxID=2789366 RepID=A0ACC1K951_9FUNG|nr:alpha 1,2 mannosyltransferase [Coemansia nantahalensis]KAJ2775859.1 alpha 1,2 mannosyltransferase [Coemansia nantahalensis]
MRRTRAAHAALVLARVLLAASPAYIHPDEFFQAPEIAAGDILGVDVLRTWEFAPLAPVRSIAPIYLYAGTPLALLRAAGWLLQRLGGWRLELTPWRLVCVSRAFMAVASLAVDACLVRAVRRLNPGARMQATMLLLASSHCLAVLCCHTFANAFAAIVLAACLDLLSLIEARCVRRAAGSVALPCAALGAALALGAFTHLTFGAFALPLGVAAAAMLARYARRGLLAVAGGGAAAALGLMAADRLYYGSSTPTVLNNLRYNSSRSNLAAHGIHPWYMHLAVSLPVLFGPLALLAAAKAWCWARAPASWSRTSYLSAAAAGSVVVGLAALSAVPHQEPRFLIPALPGLVLCTWRWHRLALARFWYLWVAFNVILAVAFGVVHQAGVVPVLGYVSSTSVLPAVDCRSVPSDPAHAVCTAATGSTHASTAAGTDPPRVRTRVLFVSTYMAPRHLLAQPVAPDALQARVELHDLVGMDDGEIRREIGRSVHVSCSLLRQSNGSELVVRQTRPGRFERTLVVLPASTDMARIEPPDAAAGYELVPLYSYRPHVDFDDIAAVLRHPWQRARLGVFAVCANAPS